MVKRATIKHDDGLGAYDVYYSPDYEYVNPIEHYASSLIEIDVSMMRDLVLYKRLPFPVEIIDRAILQNATEYCLKKLKDIEEIQVPDNLIGVLKANSKRKQVQLLKNLAITPEQLISFIFKAWTDYGFSFSQYFANHHQKGLDLSKMPKFVEIKGNQVNKAGQTSLSDGQLRQAVEHRKVVVSKFLDRNNEWHCFFLSFNSLRGNESWKDGQAHYHYISDKFGLTREKVVKELKSSKYNLGNLPHIDLIGYRDEK